MRSIRSRCCSFFDRGNVRRGFTILTDYAFTLLIPCVILALALVLAFTGGVE